MKDREYMGKWSSTKAEAKYRALDEAVWQRHDNRPEVARVDGTWGTTAAHHWAGSGTPIIFLAGVGDSAVRWVHYAAALSGHDMFAIDTMGDVGQSVQAKGLRHGDDYAHWLAETMEGLGIDRACLVGQSMGGYIALNTAALLPDRAASVVLFDPVGMVELKLAKFMMWGFANGVGAKAPARLRPWFARRLRMPVIDDKVGSRALFYGQTRHPIRVPPLDPLSDERLAGVTAPVHLVVGEKSVAFDISAMTKRAETHLAHCRVNVLTDAGHALTDSHFDECLATIRRSLC